MGIAKMTDQCCTVCCVAVCGAMVLTVGLAVDVCTSPVIVPIYLVRTKKYRKAIEDALDQMSPQEKEGMYNELCVSHGHKLEFGHFVRYIRNTNHVKHQDLNIVKLEKLHSCFSKSIIWNKVPPLADVSSSVISFAKEVARQSSMSLAERAREQHERLRNAMQQYRS